MYGMMGKLTTDPDGMRLPLARIAGAIASVLLLVGLHRSLLYHSGPTSSIRSRPSATQAVLQHQRAAAKRLGQRAPTAASTSTFTAAPKPQSQPWMRTEKTALVLNEAARAAFGAVEPRGTTIHFTFGSAVMMDFVKNWLHFIRKAQLAPILVGAADTGLFKFCTDEGLPAAAISPELDVWTYERKPRAATDVYQIKTEWKYFRHHNSDFLEMGLVKVAFLWELLSAGFSVLISDLDVVWLNGHWQRWMTWEDAAAQPVAEASLIALADVLVTTDELDAAADARGRRPSTGQDLNTGVVYFRAGLGALAMVQEWRKAMLARKGDKDLNENVNDQSLFNSVVQGPELGGAELRGWLTQRNRSSLWPLAERDGVRRVYRSHQPLPPCLPSTRCEGARFTFGTLPMRPFTGGHTWFNQNVQQMAGSELPQFEPITVHFTFQFGDTGSYPHGKRQRAREAALWAVDPPDYFTEGIFVALKGPTYTAAQQAEVYGRFPEWSPQRHMFMDAPQRQAVRDLLGLATALDNKGVMVMPKLWCHCDRYWGFLRRCRFPFIQSMPLPFNCPQDALYDPMRWNTKKMRFREHTFLQNPSVPAVVRENTLTLSVAAEGVAPRAATGRDSLELPYGTPMSSVMAAVRKVNPDVRVVEVTNEHLRRLCRWLGSADANAEFNALMRYVLTESSRYCPEEDHDNYGAGFFDWQNPFSAYNCTWGFIHPELFPTDAAACSGGADAVPRLAAFEKAERGNSTTCPRQMLCDFNTLEDGRINKPITWCNIEGYNGMKQDHLGTTRAMLAKMPAGRCPYPPGDVPGPGPGFNCRGHYVGGDKLVVPGKRGQSCRE